MEIATADSWYKSRKLDDGITFICEPWIKEFYRCNIWHLHGREKDLLVDSGMGVLSLRQAIPILSERPCLAVASHTHFDHIGCHYEFAERLVHEAEAEILASPDRKATLADPYVTDEIFTKLPPAPYSSTEYAVQSAPATRLLLDGDIVDLGDRHLQVIHTPGHSPGEIMLWEEASGILFSGDMVYDGPLIDNAYHSDIEAYVASMKRIYDLPVRIVHGGHFPSFSGERYRELIREYLNAKGA